MAPLAPSGYAYEPAWREEKKELNSRKNSKRDRMTRSKSSEMQEVFFVFLFYLPYLSSIHEKANCIAILWMGSPHSLGSCLFRDLWATCLPHKGGASR